MTRFAYKAIPLSQSGAGVVSGQVEAADEAHLRALLREQGLVPVDVRPERVTDAIRSLVARRDSNRRDAPWFFSTLRLLLENQVPLESAVGTMEELAPSARLSRACAQIRSALRQGDSLAQAVGEHKGLLSDQHRALLEAAQSSGRIDHSVGLIDRSIQARSRLTRTIAGRLIYPAVLLTVSVGAVWFLSTFVIPRFAETLESLGGELPFATRATLMAGRLLAFALPPLAIVLVVLFALRRRLIPRAMRDRVAERSLRLPVIGTLLWHMHGAVTCDVMATMLEGGADVLQSIDQASRVVGSPVIRERLESARAQVREGADLGEAIAANEVLPPLISTIVKLGMRTGELSQALRKASEICLEVQEKVSQRLLVLMEPAIILFLAGTVGWVVYSLVSGMLAMNDLGAM